MWARWRRMCGIFVMATATCMEFVVCISPGALGSEPNHDSATLFRDTVYLNDPDRDFSIIWDRGNPRDPKSCGLIRHGDDKCELLLRGSDNIDRPVHDIPLRESTQFESWHWRAFRVPASTPMDVYQIIINGRPKGTLSVMATRQWQRINVLMSLGTPTDAITTRLKSSDVVLAPGEYMGTISLSPGAKLRGYGAVLTGTLVLAPGCNVTGLTVDGECRGIGENCVIDSCTFRRGMVGPLSDPHKPNEYADHGCLWRDCLFQNTTVVGCSSGCFLRCKWDGLPARGGHNFCHERAQRLAVINCIMDTTDRGLINRCTWGDNSDNLYAGLQFRNINQTPNGGELFCIEGNRSPLGFNRNLIFCVRQIGCVGSVMLFDGAANDNLFDNVRIPFDITGQAPQIGNVIRDSEVPYVHINWPKDNGGYYSGAENTLLEDVACVAFRPSARGLPTGDPKYFRPGKFRAVVQDGAPNPSTKLIRVTVRDQAEGYKAFSGVAP